MNFIQAVLILSACFEGVFGCREMPTNFLLSTWVNTNFILWSIAAKLTYLWSSQSYWTKIAFQPCGSAIAFAEALIISNWHFFFLNIHCRWFNNSQLSSRWNTNSRNFMVSFALSTDALCPNWKKAFFFRKLQRFIAVHQRILYIFFCRYKDANPVDPSSTVGIFNDGTELRISTIRNEDIGDYTCIARNGEGQVSHTARVIIAGGAVIMVKTFQNPTTTTPIRIRAKEKKWKIN